MPGQSNSNINPFGFKCDWCNKKCSPLHIVVTTIASYYRENNHFCSPFCAGEWLNEQTLLRPKPPA